jgi:small-conductance mechanosensitive channel
MNEINKLTEKFLSQPVLEIAKNKISLEEILYSLLIIVVAYFIFLGFKTITNIQIKRKKVRGVQGKTLIQLFKYMVSISTFFFIMNTLGYSLSYIFLGSTVLLVGLGFGLQQLFLDLISGVILLIDKNVNLGDVVKVDMGGSINMFGKIYHIGLRTTLLQTLDNEFIIIPNSKLLSSGAKSLMRDKGSVRFRINVGVHYATDMALARKIIKQVMYRDVRVDQDPATTIILKDFTDHSILLEARFYMKEIFNSENILSDLRFEILEEFRKNNINIPYPQIVIHQPK